MKRDKVYMDNFNLTFTAHGEPALLKALDLIAMGQDIAIGWKVKKEIGDFRLTFFWYTGHDKDVYLMPARMYITELVPQIRAWLDQVPYPKEPDHDGDNKQGFTITTGGHLDHGAVFEIRPTWAIIGK